jgi:hypothetical protein
MMDPTREHKILRKSQKKFDRDPGNDETGIRGRKHKPQTESPNTSRPKKERQVKSKVKIMPIFFGTNGNFYKEFV